MLLKTFRKSFFKTSKRYLINDCQATIKINILKEVIPETPVLSRLIGIPTQIDFYDTHRLKKNVKYLQSSLKTILLLPGTTTNYKTYEHLIDNLFESLNYRVLALNFPGF